MSFTLFCLELCGCLAFTTSSIILTTSVCWSLCLSCSSFFTFSIAGSSPRNVSWQGTSRPPWGKSSELFLSASDWSTSGQKQVAQCRYRKLGAWPTMESSSGSSFFTATSYKSCNASSPLLSHTAVLRRSYLFIYMMASDNSISRKSPSHLIISMHACLWRTYVAK